MQKYLLSNHVLYHIPHSCYATKFIHPEDLLTNKKNVSYVFIHQIKITMVSRWELPPSFDSHASHATCSKLIKLTRLSRLFEEPIFLRSTIFS